MDTPPGGINKLPQDSGRDAPQPGRLYQLCFLEPLSSRPIKQNLVVVRLPDRGKLDHSRTVQTKVDPAGLPPSNKDPLGHVEGAGLKLTVLTQGYVDVFPKIVHAVNLVITSQHFDGKSPDCARRLRRTQYSVQMRENGVSADKGHYRQDGQQDFAPEFGILGDLRIQGRILAERYPMHDKQMVDPKPARRGLDYVFFSSLQATEKPFTMPRLAYFSSLA